jgi:exonuclease III
LNPKLQDTLSCPNKLYFVPSCLLSNVMSLAPKIDEIALTITQQDIDIVFITETWLRQSIPNDPINIKGYQLFRRDRTNRLHGGVCLYVKTVLKVRS